MKEKATNTIFWTFAITMGISGVIALIIRVCSILYGLNGLTDTEISSTLAIVSALCSFVATIIAMIILAKNEESCDDEDEDDEDDYDEDECDECIKGVTEQVKALTEQSAELIKRFDALLELLSGDVPPKPAEPFCIPRYRPDEPHRRRSDGSNSVPKMDMSPRCPDPMKDLLSKIDSGEL